MRVSKQVSVLVVYLISPMVKAPALSMRGLGFKSQSSYTTDVDQLAFYWPPDQMPCVLGSVLGLVHMVSIFVTV